MLAPSRLPLRYHWFNLKWGAPNGRLVRALLPREKRMDPWQAMLVGCFAYQGNNSTRAFEYPWVYETVGPKPGLKVLEIGGSLSGLQFALSRAGCDVINVDPGDEFFTGRWPATAANVNRLNGLFGTDVDFRQCYLADAGFKEGTFDRIMSVSVFEHIPEEALAGILQDAAKLLKPGGLLVLTVDLFLNVHPFTPATSNEYGHNVSVRWMVETSGLELVRGNKAELYGFDEFQHARISAGRSGFLVGRYPAMVQTVVMRKPERQLS